MDPRELGRLDHLLPGGARVAVLDIVEDGVVEEGRLLRHDADVLPQRLELDALQVLAVDRDATRGRVVESIEQPKHCTLARTACTDDGHCLTGRYPKRGAVQDLALLEREGDLVENNLAAALGEDQVFRRRRIGDRRRDVLECHHRLHVYQRLSNLSVYAADEVERHR